MRLYTIAVLASAWLAVGPATAEETTGRPSWLSQELAGRVAGKPSDCIFRSRVAGPMLVDRMNILYREHGGRIWRQDLGDSCPSLREDMIIVVVQQSDTRLCRNDRFRPLDRNSRLPGATCSFGRFVPYDRP